jgi:hypothetical protein
MAKGGTRTVFTDAIVKPSSGASDLELEGGPKTAGDDFEINGAKPVIIVGDGELHPWLKEIE